MSTINFPDGVSPLAARESDEKERCHLAIAANTVTTCQMRATLHISPKHYVHSHWFH